MTAATSTRCRPTSARTRVLSAATGSTLARRAAYSHRSMVDTPKLTGNRVLGCCQVLLLSASSAARSSPARGGAASKGPMTREAQPRPAITIKRVVSTCHISSR